MNFLRLKLFVFLLLIQNITLAQSSIPNYYQREQSFDDALEAIIKNVGLDSTYEAGEDGTETISFAVIDLNGREPVFGGIHAQNLIYRLGL